MSIRIAIDIGGEVSHIFVGRFEDNRLSLRETHAFTTPVQQTDEGMIYDVETIISKITTSLEEISRDSNHIDTIAISASGGVFGLVSDGEIIKDPYRYYRPSELHPDKINEKVNKDGQFKGRFPENLFIQYQENPDIFSKSDLLLPFPQLLAYKIGAEPAVDYTSADALHIFDPNIRDWDDSSLYHTGIPHRILPEIRPYGDVIGVINSSLTQNMSSTPDILMIPSHSFTSATAAVPFTPDSGGVLIGKSRFAAGLSVSAPVKSTNKHTADGYNNFGTDGSFLFLLEMPGLNLIENCQPLLGDDYKEHPIISNFPVMNPDPNGPMINPADELFESNIFAGHVENKIAAYCTETRQSNPKNKEELLRCFAQSFAARVAVAVEELIIISETHSKKLHFVGPASSSELLCQMTASALGLPVEAGLTEASAVGNIVSQMKLDDDIQSYNQGRILVNSTINTTQYSPKNRRDWDSIVTRMYNLKSN